MESISPALKIRYCLSDSINPFCIFFWDCSTKLFFKCHNEFNSIQLIRTKVIKKRCVRRDLFGIYSKLFDDYFSDSVKERRI